MKRSCGYLDELPRPQPFKGRNAGPGRILEAPTTAAVATTALRAYFSLPFRLLYNPLMRYIDGSIRMCANMLFIGKCSLED
jgi:hypothetical protein